MCVCPPTGLGLNLHVYNYVVNQPDSVVLDTIALDCFSWL